MGKRKTQFVEDTFITVPASGTEITKIGDLWDCRNVKALGMNLFGGELKAENLVAYPRRNLKYNLKHIKNTKDTAFTIGVGLEMSLKVLFITLSQKGTYENIRSTKLTDDTIEFTYDIETFSVKAANSASNAVSDYVLKQLNTSRGSMDTLSATHVAVETIVGGQLRGKLVIEKTNVDVKERENSDLFAMLALIPIKMIVKALATGIAGVFGTKAKNNITFTQQSKPNISDQPRSVSAMFSLIDKLDKIVEAEKNYPGITEFDVTGVQLRFIMAPVSSFLSPSMQTDSALKLYEEIQQDLKQSFLEMMMTLMDYQFDDNIKSQIADGVRHDRLRRILIDKENPITQEITHREKELMEISIELAQRAQEIFKLYRFAIKNVYDIENIVTEFHEKFNAIELFEEMLEFRNKVKDELRAIEGGIDNMESKIIFTFTNKAKAEDWYETGNNGKVKVFIQTGVTSSKRENLSIVRGIWDLEEHLKAFPIVVAIAAPSIYSESLIKIKIGTLEKIYSEEKLEFVLEVLSTAVGKGNSWNSTLFHKLNAALDGITLPLTPENFGELNNTLGNLDGVRNTKICESNLQLEDLLSATDRRDRYQFVTTLEAEDTAYDAVSHLKRFRATISTQLPQMIAKSDWVIGEFGLFDYNEAPVLFIFKNKELLAICYDNLDLLILANLLKEAEYKNEEPALEFLSPLQIDTWDSRWLYPTRALFAKEVAKLYGYRFQELDMDDNSDLRRKQPIKKSLNFTEDGVVVDAMRFLRDCLSNDKLQILSAVANSALRFFNEPYNNIMYTLKKHGWDDSKKEFVINFLDVEKELGIFLTDLQSFSSTLSPFLAKIQFYIKILQKAIKKENYETVDIETIIQEILSLNEDLPEDVANDLRGYSNFASDGAWPEAKSFQVKGVLQILEKFVAAALKDGESKEFYLKALVGLVEQIAKPAEFEVIVTYTESNVEESKNKDGKFVGLVDLALEYINRLDLNDTEYPLLKENVLKQVANNNIFQALSILTRCKYNGYNYLILQEMNEIKSLGDGQWMTQFVRKCGKSRLKDSVKPSYEVFWENPKFKYLMMSGIESETLLEAIYIFQCDSKGVNDIPKFLPREFANRIREIAFQRQDFKMQLKWGILENFVDSLKTLYTKGFVPRDFMLQLTRGLQTNPDIKSELLEKGALFHWNEELGLFSDPWDLTTIKNAISALLPRVEEAVANAEAIIMYTNNPEDTNDKISVVGPLTKFCGDSLSVITLNEHRKVDEFIPNPDLSMYKPTEWMGIVLPFVMQQLRLKNVKAYKRDYFVPSNPLPGNDNESRYSFLTLGEIKTCLMAASVPEVAFDILQKLSIFPISLPLVTQDVEEEGRLLFLFPLLKNIAIPFTFQLNNKPEEILTTELFSKKSRLIVVVQLGQHPTTNASNRIVSTLLSSDEFFTNENSLGIEGSVDLTWLTSNHCSKVFWNSFVKNFHGRDSKEPILLAVVHGDPRNNPAMKTLGQMASSIVVLLMPQEWEDMLSAWKQFRDNVGMTYQNFVKVMIDPTESCLDKANNASKLQFDLLMDEDEDEQHKLHLIFEEAILFRGKSYNTEQFEFGEKFICKGAMISTYNSSTVIPLMGSDLKMNTPRLETVFQQILKPNPKLRVYVISILGLQGSGKSTLLNTLFGTQFEENTNGILFQLVFLKEALREEFHVDAFLIIDSGGFTSNETAWKTEDRQMAALILSLSNICLVNIMGPQMKELKDILSVALVTQMRLKNPVENSLEIILTQQTPPKKSERSSANVAEFMELLGNTIDLCNERETDLGLRVRTSQRILNTIIRTKVYDLLKTFRRYNASNSSSEMAVPSIEYHEDISNLYKMLLQNCKNSQNQIFFGDWVEMLKSNHETLLSQAFNSGFRNIDEIQSYFGHKDSYLTLKNSYDYALCIHQFNLEKMYIDAEEDSPRDVYEIINEIGRRLQLVPDSCEEESKGCDGILEKCIGSLDLRDHLFDRMKGYNYRVGIEKGLNSYKHMVTEHILHQIGQKLITKQLTDIIEDDINIQDLLDLFSEEIDYEDIDKRKQPKRLFERLRAFVAATTFVIPGERLFKQEVELEYEWATHVLNHLEEGQVLSLPKFELIEAFDVETQDSDRFLKWHQNEWLEKELKNGAQEIYLFHKDSKGDSDIYAFGMARKWRLRIDEILHEFQQMCKKDVLIDFRWAVHEYGIKVLAQFVSDLQTKWNKTNQPLDIVVQNTTDILDKFVAWSSEN